MIHALADVLRIFADVALALCAAYGVVLYIDRKHPHVIDWIDRVLFGIEEESTEAVSQ